MGSSHIRDLLTSFSPSLDFFALCSGDGRIKICDTVKGQIQTEFVDIASTGDSDLFGKPEKGHLSVDYTCMKWLSLDKKKKRKLGTSLLVLGTGSGDVLALDVSAGLLKWRVSDCHPGGVTTISFPTYDSYIYTAGVDGVVCKLDSRTGNLLEKFRASTKGINSMSVSSDGKMLATAAAQLRVVSCSDHKKTHKFSGHPGNVRCMIFTDDGRYILSSSAAERYVAVWELDGGKKQSACCVLAMDHPAVFLDSKCMDTGNVDAAGLSVLAISEMGICYFWYGNNIEELRSCKPTKVSLSLDDQDSKSQKGAMPTIFAAKLQGSTKPASGHIFLAHGLLVKPSFEKILVHSGTDLKLLSSLDGILLPISQSHKFRKGSHVHDETSALDRANAEDALHPIPKIFDFHDKKKRDPKLRIVTDNVMADDLVNRSLQVQSETKRDEVDDVEDVPSICMEDRLRTLGILDNKHDYMSDKVIDSTRLMGIDIEADLPQKKVRAAISSMVPSDAYRLLEVMVAMWQSRSWSGKYVLPWIGCILVNHSDYVISQEPVTQLLDSLHKLTKSKGASIQSLLQLSGRLHLVTTQIDKAIQNEGHNFLHDHQMDGSDDEDDDDDVQEYLYDEEDVESQSSSDDNE